MSNQHKHLPCKRCLKRRSWDFFYRGLFMLAATGIFGRVLRLVWTQLKFIESILVVRASLPKWCLVWQMLTDLAWKLYPFLWLGNIIIAYRTIYFSLFSFWPCTQQAFYGSQAALTLCLLRSLGFEHATYGSKGVYTVIIICYTCSKLFEQVSHTLKPTILDS